MTKAGNNIWGGRPLGIKIATAPDTPHPCYLKNVQINWPKHRTPQWAKSKKIISGVGRRRTRTREEMKKEKTNEGNAEETHSLFKMEGSDFQEINY